MTRHFWGWRLGVLAVALLLAGTAWGSARAQYPPPTGNVTLSTSTTAPAVGGTTTISAQVRDVAGAAVDGLACTFRIVSQPGTDASVFAGPVYTDVAGVATTSLQVGSTPGPIVVGCSCGELSSQVSVVAGTAQVQLPSTGEGPADENGNMPIGLWFLLGVPMASLALLAAGRLMRRVHR